MIFGYNGRDGVITDYNGLLYMRARYYSPELRRFINADIVPGEISNAITLNRYAYANGNPVSNIDPFGLEGFWSGLWNDVKNFGSRLWNGAKNGVNNFINKHPTLQLYISDVKSTFLYFDAAFSRNVYYDIQNKKYNKENYDYNLRNDKIGRSTNDLIDSQKYNTEINHLKLGKSTVGYAGCEIIAVYNTKLLLGIEYVSMADTIKTFEEQHALAIQDIQNGEWGGNPYSISEILAHEGIKYKEIKGFYGVKEPGIYIVSFWNSMEPTSGLHTIAIEVYNDGTAKYYNNGGENKFNEQEIFIAGYKVSRK